MTEPLELRIAPATIFAVDTNNNLIRFDSADPGTVITIAAIAGLVGSGEDVIGIDFRPATGQLYALGKTEAGAIDEGRIYTLELATGAATEVGAGFIPLAGTSFGFDFNPVVDRIRVVSDLEYNLRINPNDGTAVDADTGTPGVQRDTDLTYTVGDPNVGENPNVLASAYTDNVAGTTTTTLFAIDSLENILVRQGGVDVPPGTPSPNGGQLFTVGSLTVDPAGSSNFDILAEDKAFATMNVAGSTGLYTVNLSTGAATLVGTVGDGSMLLRGMSFAFPTLQILGPKTATYIDEDGDRVTIKVSKGTLEASDFQLKPTLGIGGVLSLINFSDDGAEFDKANLSISVKKAKTGDGFANVGFINAFEVDLGSVTIRGDLGQIDAGDIVEDTPGLAKLSVHSLGRYGTSTQFANLSLTSDILASLGALSVQTDIVDASVLVIGGTNGKIGSIKIGGSLIGGAAASSAIISATSSIGSVKVGRDIIGSDGSNSARISSNEDFGSVNIGGSVFGGPGSGSGTVGSANGIKSIKIGGSLVGGLGSSSGIIVSLGEIVSMKIGRDLIGGSVSGSDTLDASGLVGAGKIRALTIGGSVYAGVDDSTGTLTNSGSIQSLTDIVSLAIRGNVVGNATNPVIISATGDLTPEPGNLTIGKLSVGGKVERARILAGWISDAVNGNATIGSVAVGGDWIASDLIAGVQDDNDNEYDDGFGDANDIAIPGFDADTAIATIASIAIKGRVFGSASSFDHFGFAAQQIGKFRAGGVTYALTSGTDLPIELSPLSGDVTVREV